MSIMNCRFCTRPFNSDYNAEHEEECEMNPDNWEVLESGRQLLWALFWVILAIFLAGAIMLVAAKRTASAMSLADCIERTSEEQGFNGELSEEWALFAETCSK